MSIKRSTDNRFSMIGDWISTTFIVLLGFFLIYWLLDYSLWLALIFTLAFAFIGFLRIKLIASGMLVAQIDNELTRVTSLCQAYEERIKALEASIKSATGTEGQS